MGETARMQLKTILNHVQKFKSFVYGVIVWLDPDKRSALLVEVLARANSKPICSGCERPGPWYDTLPPRMFEFVPLWNIAVFFSYAMRRVNCPRCGVKVETVPWADGKHILTKPYMHFLATWAKRLSWKETAVAFHTTWEKVFHSVEWAVPWCRQTGKQLRDEYLICQRIERFAKKKLAVDPESPIGWELLRIAYDGEAKNEFLLDEIDLCRTDDERLHAWRTYRDDF
jgi:hypothetical protein